MRKSNRSSYERLAKGLVSGNSRTSASDPLLIGRSRPIAAVREVRSRAVGQCPVSGLVPMPWPDPLPNFSRSAPGQGRTVHFLT